MSKEVFDDACPGCRPALMDVTTGKVFPPHSPQMQAIDGLWATTTYEERAAFHRFTCQNSRAPLDLAIVHDLRRRMQAALERL